LEALIDYDDEHEEDATKLLHLRICVEAGVLPLDCLAAAGMDDILPPAPP
jgi:hypothetical protein